METRKMEAESLGGTEGTVVPSSPRHGLGVPGLMDAKVPDRVASQAEETGFLGGKPSASRRAFIVADHPGDTATTWKPVGKSQEAGS